jgi:WXXGXW repeat (2 copies)
MSSKLLAGTLLTVGALLSACAPAGGMYVTAYAPPPPRYAAVGYAPGPGYVWTAGYWNRAGGNWSWVEGRWQRPPHRNAVWVAAEWRHEGKGYRFHRGYWR